jgi:hypothetical protein
VAELRRLYGRYKGLVLATAAALVLDEPTGLAVGEAEALRLDCRAAARECAPSLQSQLDACAAAADELCGVVSRGADGELTAADVEAARATHRMLRREVWKVLPCEYVPCGAGMRVHDHGGESDG